MIIFVDIDETICYYESERDYSLAKPYLERISKINSLYNNGNTIVYWTARGTITQENWFNITYQQLTDWNCKFHELRMGKPAYDLFIDDKNINADLFFENA
jgi:hypothetical protein